MRAVRRKILTDTDRAEWAVYARALQPLPGRDFPALPDLPGPPPNVAAMPRQNPPGAPRLRAAAKLAAVAVGEHPAGLDRASWHRFRTGKLLATRTLDLHGRTAQRAHHALETFLHAAHADGVRCVEIITGRGTGESGGVLKRELPHWLNQPGLRQLVLAASHPHAANPGSVRLLLRRAR